MHIAPRILLIDRDSNALRVREKLVGQAGYTVLTASSGETGLTEAARERPAMIVVDGELTDPEGLEVVRQLRRDARTSRAKLLLMSARSSPEDILIGIQMGADDYLVKREGVEAELLDRIRALFPLSDDEAARTQLAEFNELKTNLVANISHELRTPLNQIKGYNALLLDAALGPVNDEQQNALRVSNRAIMRLEQLVDDLISYAQTAKGDVFLSLRPLEVAAVIGRAVEKVSPMAARKAIRLESQNGAEDSLVLGDAEKLHWVFLQLLDNAIKFTPAGGRVTVSATPMSDQVCFVVADTGIGIPPARLPEIFEAFQQLDGTSTRRYGGTGLGLALVRRIISAHGSRVQADSVEGQGSQFAFALARSMEG